MASGMEDVQSQLECRVQRLERLTRGLTMVVVSFLVLFVLAARPARIGEVVRAERLQIVDTDGRVRIDLRHDSTETGVFVLDGAGDTRIGVAQFAHGGGGIALHGPHTRGAAVLYLKGSGSLSFYDSAGTVVARFPGQ